MLVLSGGVRTKAFMFPSTSRWIFGCIACLWTTALKTPLSPFRPAAPASFFPWHRVPFVRHLGSSCNSLSTTDVGLRPWHDRSCPAVLRGSPVRRGSTGGGFSLSCCRDHQSECAARARAAGKFTRQYIDSTVPAMAFGEFWDTCEYTDGVLNYNQDNHRQRTVTWCDQTGGTAAAFDFTTKGESAAPISCRTPPPTADRPR